MRKIFNCLLKNITIEKKKHYIDNEHITLLYASALAEKDVMRIMSIQESTAFHNLNMYCRAPSAHNSFTSFQNNPKYRGCQLKTCNANFKVVARKS